MPELHPKNHKFLQNQDQLSLEDYLLCHYCGFKSFLKRECSKEGFCEFIFCGPGVERISEEVKKSFPSKKIEIFSSDTMNKKSSKEKLEKIINNEIEIIVGTQLISKGFHFPNLNCIVVVDIDLSLMGHDLRSAEKNLQLYHQLSGRAGRTGSPSTIYFQTYNFNTKLIDDITNKNPEIFLDKEIEIRKKKPAFHPNATQLTLHLGDALFAFWRESLDRDQSIFAIHNLSDQSVSVPLHELNLISTENWQDLLSGKALNNLNQEITLEPYASAWLSNL